MSILASHSLQTGRRADGPGHTRRFLQGFLGKCPLLLRRERCRTMLVLALQDGVRM